MPLKRILLTQFHVVQLWAGAILAALLIVVALYMWNHKWTVAPLHPPQLSYEAFKQATGYSVGFDLYLPNSYTGWTPNKDNKLIYNNHTNTYDINNIDISGEQVDDWGARFKITSVDWQNEFGVVFADATNEQSKFGIPKEGAVLHLRHYVDSRDMYFELPQHANATHINIKLKVTSKDFHPTALMFIEYGPTQVNQ